MSETSALKKSLPAMEYSFSLINEEGNLTKKSFEGNFTCRISNLKMQAQIEKFRATLDGGIDGLDLGIRRLHAMLAYLKFTLTDSPKWWKDSDYGYELLDISIVETVYNKVLKFEKDWVESIWGKPESEEVVPSETKEG